MAIFRTLLSQAKQISGSATYDDTLTMSGAESYLEKSLEGDLNYVRSQLKAITGETNWYDTPDIDLATLASQEAGFSGSLQNIFDFTGMDDRNDSTPTYSSTTIVSNSTSLETAIGALDAGIAGISESDTLDNVCDRGATTDQSITVAGLDAGSGTIETTGNVTVGGTLFVQGGENTRIDSEIHTAGSLGVSGSSVLGDDAATDTVDIVGDARVHRDLYMNYDGGDGDSTIYFYEGSSTTGASLMWDDDPGEFAFDKPLSMGSNQIHDVVDPDEAQDVVTLRHLEGVISGSSGASLTLDEVLGNGATSDVAMTISASGSSFSTLTVYGLFNVGGNIDVVGTVDGVDVAGFATAAQTFTGMDDAADSTPTYSSTLYVANDDSLETAIGKLDAAIGTVDIAKEVERLTSGVASGSAHTVPGSNSHAAGDGTDMDIYLNGQLLQSNTGTELRDYLESGSDEVKFTFAIPTNSYLTYIIRD